MFSWGYLWWHKLGVVAELTPACSCNTEGWLWRPSLAWRPCAVRQVAVLWVVNTTSLLPSVTACELTALTPYISLSAFWLYLFGL